MDQLSKGTIDQNKLSHRPLLVFFIDVFHYIEAATLIFLIGKPSFQLDFDVVQVVHGLLILAQQVLSLFAYDFNDGVVVLTKVFL
jgi:hypothetical protein